MKHWIAFVTACSALVVAYFVSSVVFRPRAAAPTVVAASQPASAPSTQPERPKLVALMPDAPGFHNLQFSMRVGTQYVNRIVTLPCRIYIPREYDKNKDPRPLLVYLHGDDARGTDLTALASIGPEKRLREDQGFRDNFRAICVSPQCPPDETWDDGDVATALLGLVDELARHFRVDADHVALTGTGAGAAGAWRLAATDPERFSAVAVNSPGGAPLGGEEPAKLRHLFSYVAAAQNDKPSYGVYLATVDGLGKAKADLQFRTNGNNAKECATWFYADNGTFDWLFNHKRRTPDERRQRDERDAKELAEALASLPKLPGQYKLKFNTWVGDKKIEVPYQLSLPRGYDANNAPCPTILFLSGAGEQNPDLSAINSHGPCAKMHDDPGFKEWCPFIVISPCHDNSPERAKAICELLDDLGKKVRIDPDRVYVTGLSLGGTSTWTVANAAPDKFAAAVPISARDRCWDVAAQNMKYMTTWIIVGGADGDFTAGSNHMHQVLSAAGDDVHLTVIPNEGHGPWARYYNERRFYDWLLEHRRLSPDERKARDAHPFGDPSKALADAAHHPDVLKPGHHWLELATQLGGKPYKLVYSLYLPKGYDAAKNDHWPMMVYLHHDEFRDAEQSLIFQWGSGVDPRRDQKSKPPLPLIGLVPQLPHDKQWTDPEIQQLTFALMDEVSKHVRIDPDRVYASGYQNGGTGAWALALQAPSRFAALAPMQGGVVKPDEVAKKLKSVAARVLAPANDGGAVNAAKQMVDAMKKAGADAVLDQVQQTQDPNQWMPFYTNPELVNWLLAHHRPAQAARAE